MIDMEVETPCHISKIIEMFVDGKVTKGTLPCIFERWHEGNHACRNPVDGKIYEFQAD